MKKKLSLVLASVLVLTMFAGCASKTETVKEPTKPTEAVSEKEEGKVEEEEKTIYPDGVVTIYNIGQPHFRQEFYDGWLERNRDIAPGVKIEIVQSEDQIQMRERITMTALSGDDSALPDATYGDPVFLMNLAEGGFLKEVTDFVTPLASKMVDGAIDDATIGGKVYGLPDSVRPNILFYNEEIFNKYDVDPELLDTFDGYIEAGRQLKEKSNGEVYLSYVSPGSRTWRYYGRRGLMPQANARIWDESGEVIIGEDEGTKLALGTLDTLLSEDLLYKSEIMEPALYDAINNQKVATFYIGAFWGEFLRKNCQETAGQWKVKPSPIYEEIGTRGAPVSNYFCIVNKGDNVYAGLLEKMWEDFTFNIEEKEKWVTSMEAQDAPYSNPVSLEMLKEDFWKEPSEFYGGQSFREAEGKFLENGSMNLPISPQDAEADEIISAEIENYVAGNQTISEAIANMDKNLKSKIGKADFK